MFLVISMPSIKYHLSNAQSLLSTTTNTQLRASIAVDAYNKYRVVAIVCVWLILIVIGRFGEVLQLVVQVKG